MEISIDFKYSIGDKVIIRNTPDLGDTIDALMVDGKHPGSVRLWYGVCWADSKKRYQRRWWREDDLELLEG